jgi:hypothetical protein
MSQRDPEKTNAEKREHRPAVHPTRPGDDSGQKPDEHQGAAETEVADVTPPARGPAGPARPTKEDEEIDPTDDLTPG